MYLNTIFTWSEKKRQAWAARKLDAITDAHVLALNMMGWRIVTDYEGRWPFDSKRTLCDCPEWCDDMSKPRVT